MTIVLNCTALCKNKTKILRILSETMLTVVAYLKKFISADSQKRNI